MTDDTAARARSEASIDELIALGRDREAVAAATRDLRAGAAARETTRDDRGGSDMDAMAQVDEVLVLLDGVVTEITPEQLDAETPCASLTVAGVLEHMVGGATVFAPAFRGADAPPSPAPTGTPPEQFRAAMVELAGAVHSPGAQERTIPTPFGSMPGDAFTRYLAFDGLVHGWDLAVATGRPYTPREELVAAVDQFARGLITDDVRDGDTFANATDAPEGANRLEQLIAFTGRHVPTKDGSR